MKASIKLSGSYRDASEIHTKVSGTWRAVQSGWVKVSGTWQQFYSAVPPPPPFTPHTDEFTQGQSGTLAVPSGASHLVSQDINSNIAQMERLRSRTETSPWNFVIPLYGLTTLGQDWDDRLNQFKQMVERHGSWDYKDKGLKEYEAGGNFNYGATGAAAGIPEWLLLRAAGWYQDPRAKGGGIPWLTAPYGDDPKDQEQIKKGYDFYQDKNKSR